MAATGPSVRYDWWQCSLRLQPPTAIAPITVAQDPVALVPSGPLAARLGAGEGTLHLALLPRPVREVTILVTAARFCSAYEVYAHVIVAEQRGLSDEKLATIVAGQRPEYLSREEAIAHDVAAALVDGHVLPELTDRQAVAAFGGTLGGGADPSGRALLPRLRDAERVRRSGAGVGALSLHQHPSSRRRVFRCRVPQFSCLVALHKTKSPRHACERSPATFSGATALAT